MDDGQALAEATNVNLGNFHQTASPATQRASPTTNGIAGLFAQKPTGLLEIDDDDEHDHGNVGKSSRDASKDDICASLAGNVISIEARHNGLSAASPPSRGNTAQMQ